MVFPNIGQVFVPVRVRLLFGLAFTFAVYPVLSSELVALPPSVSEMLFILAMEFIIGLAIGTVFRFALSTMATAGSVIAFMIGLSNAQLFNPLQAQQSQLPSVFLVLLGSVLIFSSELHHGLIRTMVFSYRIFPVHEPLFFGDYVTLLAQSLALSFKTGVQLSAPFIFIGLIIFTLFGVATRLAPQVQIFFVALPVQVWIGLFVLMTVLPGIGLVFLTYYEERILMFLP